MSSRHRQHGDDVHLAPGQGGDFSGISNGCALTVSYYASVDGLPPARISAQFLSHWIAPSGFTAASGITAYGACFH
ncbi:hypothetical protein [Conexibacter sp. DBS9H8]|uniref:hypothetical protein n=1 Tax=Conexibacter sp. DBS9H8 TaxID=2937801 RepID=UPI00200C4FF9|nr:hypothetical protein [Conexibacter sp. DBS9H8]